MVRQDGSCSGSQRSKGHGPLGDTLEITPFLTPQPGPFAACSHAQCRSSLELQCLLKREGTQVAATGALHTFK